MRGGDLFGHAPPPDPLIGQAICMGEPCRFCATNVAVICAARGEHTAGLKCRNCDAMWTAGIDFQVLRAAVAEISSYFGAPAEIKYTTIQQRSKTMSDQQYDDTNRGALFKNTDKVKETERDYSGTLNVGGTEYWVSGWVKTSKKGMKFLSLSIKPKDDNPAKTSKSHTEDMNDQIPF